MKEGIPLTRWAPSLKFMMNKNSKSAIEICLMSVQFLHTAKNAPTWTNQTYRSKRWCSRLERSKASKRKSLQRATAAKLPRTPSRHTPLRSPSPLSIKLRMNRAGRRRASKKICLAAGRTSTKRSSSFPFSKALSLCPNTRSTLRSTRVMRSKKNSN